MDPIQDYFNLVRRIDRDARRLAALHSSALTCRPGCHDCCTNLTVFPVEFQAIRRALTEADTLPGKDDFDSSAACGFLQKGLCRIYPFRPLICRTHGLPILFLDDTSGEYTWEVSFCEQNFTGREQIEFTQEMLLNIEDINGELSSINQDFLASTPPGSPKHLSRIALKDLCP